MTFSTVSTVPSSVSSSSSSLAPASSSLAAAGSHPSPHVSVPTRRGSARNRGTTQPKPQDPKIRDFAPSSHAHPHFEEGRRAARRSTAAGGYTRTPTRMPTLGPTARSPTHMRTGAGGMPILTCLNLTSTSTSGSMHPNWRWRWRW
ncbi:hypothetical protein NLJ89_g11073 [Agrocybe chaxingu]|uniref:Uncharacterized protein n=1 Tax=Agrocybe chaxingu TaxID=84603 RepID=A0A9W8JPF0_9AGAR|nr:hypothetical protein NLJ89_g11073 [Agrocybe chaxingu]